MFKNTFGRDSKEFLYISIYEEFPSRDDLGRIVINPPKMTGNVEKTMNYIVRNRGLWTIYLNVYKTMDFFGRVDIRFSEATSKLITNYIARQRVAKRRTFVWNVREGQQRNVTDGRGMVD